MRPRYQPVSFLYRARTIRPSRLAASLDALPPVAVGFDGTRNARFNNVGMIVILVDRPPVDEEEEFVRRIDKKIRRNAKMALAGYVATNVWGMKDLVDFP
jgi:hypothetical protein